MTAPKRLPPWHEHFRLPSGRELLIRPIRPEDAGPIQGAFGLLGPEEIRHRFLYALKELSPEMAQRLTHPDPNTEFALVAAEPLPPGEALVGAVARAALVPRTRDAEFAILVSHFIAGQGLGRHLMRKLAKWARSKKLDRLYGDVLSPGPCDPAQAGICLPLTMAAAEARVPLLGVCLGHQTIGEAFGGKVVRCHEIVHGKMGSMHHAGKGVFRGLPSPFLATRYHSLVVERESLPDCLEVTAWLEDGTIMGLRHKERLIEGVQFHPESIASEHGHQLLRNFLEEAHAAARVPA